MDSNRWHERFTQQARWTSSLRSYLYNQIRLEPNSRVLEVGCGTGAVLSDDSSSQASRFGLDLNARHLVFAGQHIPAARLVQGDALHLPFTSAIFDAVFCHYLLLWVADPFRTVQEMLRVAIPGGAVLAFAEPDYGGRIDHPPDFEMLGAAQARSLVRQGADPQMGRKLAGLFQSAGLEQVESGVLGAQWRLPAPSEDLDLEWSILRADLSLSEIAALSSEQIDRLQDADRRAWADGSRVLYVPTFYVWGRVPPQE